MNRLPDFEALAIFAKVAESRSFAATAEALGVSKGTVSKAIKRLEEQLGTTLLHRSSRRFAVTDCGRTLAVQAAEMLATAEAAVSKAVEHTVAPRGLVRVAAPMSFGAGYLAPALGDFLKDFPEISVDLHLSDEIVDLVGQGFDLALRIAALQDSTLLARKLREVKRHVVAAPEYFARRGKPAHPSELNSHACLPYTNLPNPEVWRFSNSTGQDVVVHPSGPLRSNNAEALNGALLAGLGIAVQPDFICGGYLAGGQLEAVLAGWSLPPIALHLVSPPTAARPKRVTALMEFLAHRFGASSLT